MELAETVGRAVVTCASPRLPVAFVATLRDLDLDLGTMVGALDLSSELGWNFFSGPNFPTKTKSSSEAYRQRHDVS